MSLQDEVDAAARETAMRLDMIALRLDWEFIGRWNGLGKAKKIYHTHTWKFRSPEHVVAVIEGRIAL